MKTSYHEIIREQSGVPLELPEEILKEQKDAELKAQGVDFSREVYENWQKEPVTKEFFSKISSEIDALETRARELACTSTSNEKANEINQLLVRSAELRKLKVNYA